MSLGTVPRSTHVCTAVSRKVVQQSTKAYATMPKGIMVNCQFESTKTWRQCYRKKSARNACSCFVTDIDISVSFKIQSNDPDRELVTKGWDSQRKYDSDDFNLTYFAMLCAQRKSRFTCRAIANEPFASRRVLVA